MANSNGLFSVNDRTAEFDQNDAQQNKVMGILSYIGILVLIPIFAAKNSKFARFHANQGLVIAICEIASYIVLSLLLGRIPYVGGVFTFINFLLDAFLLVLSILGIVFSAKGQAKELPIVGKIKILK